MGFALRKEYCWPNLQLIEYSKKQLAEIIPLFPESNSANQLIQQINADGGVISYAYNDLGKVYSLTDPNGNTTYFDYDMIGRLISETDPLSHTTNYDYDKVGNLIQKTTPRGDTITFAYDALNRLTQKVTPEQTYAFTYDSLGRLTNATNTSSNLNFVYDSIGQLTQSVILHESVGSSVSLTYSYDIAGRKTSLTDPIGTTQYQYDSNGRLIGLIDPHANTFNFSYDLGGRRIGKTLTTQDSSLTTDYSYDNANLLTELLNKVNDVEVAPFQYQYDAVGNKTRAIDKHGIHDYSYDQVYRLLLTSNNNESFNYDQTGNRTSDQTQSYSVNEANQIVSSSSGLNLSYDSNGNVASKIENGITWTYTFNSQNQLTQAQSSDGKNILYTYDALGRRISKTSEGTTTQFVYDGDSILLEYENGTLVNRYTQGSGTDEHLGKADLANGKNYYYHSDSLGSITAITDNTGSIVESYQYSSYGIPTVFDADGQEINSSGIGNPFLFTGREWDPETGTYYHRNRYRFADLGIWMSKDPQGFDDGPNLYSYVGNNPINWTDPYGLWHFYGNWGGPDWSGGQRKSYEDVTDEEMACYAPIDSMDECFKEHDRCFAECRQKPCQVEPETDFDRIINENCFKTCHWRLYNCLRNLDRDPRRWENPAPDPASASRHRRRAEWFSFWAF